MRSGLACFHFTIDHWPIYHLIQLWIRPTARRNNAPTRHPRGSIVGPKTHIGPTECRQIPTINDVSKEKGDRPTQPSIDVEKQIRNARRRRFRAKDFTNHREK